MTTAARDEARLAALDAYLSRYGDDGYRIETRTDRQAVICRRHRLYFLLRWLARGSAERRLVLSVDEDGKVTAVAAEPVRW